MDNQHYSFGPGSTTLGGADGVANAMGNPGGVSALQTQVSPSSAIFNPALAQQNPMPMPQGGNPMGQFGMQAAMNPQVPQQQPQAQPQEPNAPQPKGESNSIIEALTTRLKDIAKLERSLYGVQ